ncbi:MAG: EamA family transporter [Dehalococcoidales bacterium]|nr:EamA family transporter [Dehalococcoidales bacterium]
MFIGEIFALTSALAVGIGAILSKFLTTRVKFLFIQAFRSLIGGVFLILMCFVLGKGNQYLEIPPQYLLMTLGAAITGITIGDAIYIKILSIAPVSQAFPVITGTRVLFTTIAGALFFQEAASWSTGLAAVLIVSGVYLALSSRGAVSPVAPTGDGIKKWLPLALLVGFLWSVYYVLMKFVLAEVDPMIASSIDVTVAAIVLGGVLMLQGGRETLGLKQYGRNTLLLISANGILIYGFSLLLELYALDIAGLGNTAILVSWTPVFVLILSSIFLKERATLRLILGTTACVVGTLLLVIF